MKGTAFISLIYGSSISTKCSLDLIYLKDLCFVSRAAPYRPYRSNNNEEQYNSYGRSNVKLFLGYKNPDKAIQIIPSDEDKGNLIMESGMQTEDDNFFINEVDELFGFIVDEEDSNEFAESLEGDLEYQQELMTSSMQQAILANDKNWTLSGDIRLAPASEIAYFFLQNTIGLSEDIMWKITTEYGSILGLTVFNLKQKITLLRRTLSLNDDDIRTIISKQPSILHLNADRNLSPTISYLARSLELSKDDLRAIVVKYPAILCYSQKNLRKKVHFLNNDMGYGISAKYKLHLRDILLQEPRILISAVTTLKERMDFLHKEMCIPVPDLRDIIIKNPRILLYSVTDNLQMKLISLFIMRLNMKQEHVLKILKAYPKILDYSLEEHLLPITKYFILELEFSPTEFRSILLKFPRLMTYSLYKIKHTVGYFRFTLGMNAKQVKRVLFQAPQTVSLSTDDTLVSKVDFLKEALRIQDSNDLNKIVAGMPTLLLCSVEKNLQPKVDYLLDVFNGDEAIMRHAFLLLPTLMGYSLEKRIKPRMSRILDVGVDPIKITVGITMKEEAFEEWLDNKLFKMEIQRPQKDESISQSSSSSIVLRRNTEQSEQTRGKRIIHWKRH